jgi:hypothetical protein
MRTASVRCIRLVFDVGKATVKRLVGGEGAHAPVGFMSVRHVVVASCSGDLSGLRIPLSGGYSYAPLDKSKLSPIIARFCRLDDARKSNKTRRYARFATGSTGTGVGSLSRRSPTRALA